MNWTVESPFQVLWSFEVLSQSLASSYKSLWSSEDLVKVSSTIIEPSQSSKYLIRWYPAFPECYEVSEDWVQVLRSTSFQVFWIFRRRFGPYILPINPWSRAKARSDEVFGFFRVLRLLEGLCTVWTAFSKTFDVRRGIRFFRMIIEVYQRSMGLKGHRGTLLNIIQKMSMYCPVRPHISISIFHFFLYGVKEPTEAWVLVRFKIECIPLLIGLPFHWEQSLHEPSWKVSQPPVPLPHLLISSLPTSHVFKKLLLPLFQRLPQ